MKVIIKNLVFINLVLVLSIVLPQSAYTQNDQTDLDITKVKELENYKDSYIKGKVIKILDEDEFRLEDDSGTIKVYTGWKNTNIVKKDEIVIVKGKLDPGIINEFYASEIIKEDGKKIELEADE